jgi:hypothetical protein
MVPVSRKFRGFTSRFGDTTREHGWFRTFGSVGKQASQALSSQIRYQEAV